MPALQIRKLDEETHARLTEEARRQRRSVAQQAAVTLQEALAPRTRKVRRQELLEQLAKEPCGVWPSTLPDPAVLVRQDRDR